MEVKHCYSLGFEVFPKGLCVKDLLTSLWPYWEVVDPLAVGLSGRKLGHWWHALEGDIETLASSLFTSWPL
jgi:hypothetical protein